MRIMRKNQCQQTSIFNSQEHRPQQEKNKLSSLRHCSVEYTSAQKAFVQETCRHSP